MENQIETGDEFNFSLVSEKENRWDIYAKDGDKLESTFMWSYSKESQTDLNNTIYFGTEWENRSITPILKSQTNVFFENKEGEVSKQFYAPGNMEPKQKLAFLKAIDDLEFWKNLLTTIGIDTTPTEDSESDIAKINEQKEKVSVLSFQIYNDSNKDNDSKAWDLNIVFSNDGNTLDANSLQNMQFLGELSEITNITVEAKWTEVRDFTYSLNIDEMNWIKDLKFLESLNFRGWQGPNTEKLKETLRVYGSPDNWEFLGKKTLKTLDLTAYRPFGKNEQAKNLIDQIYKPWINDLLKDFIVYLPKKEISGEFENNVDLNKIFKIEEINTESEKDYLKLQKITSPSFEEPKFYQDENNNWQTTILKVNNTNIKAKLLNSKLYWDFALHGMKASDVTWSDQKGQEYYTQEYVDNEANNLNKDNLHQISITPDYGNLPLPNISIQDPGKLNENNKNLLNNEISSINIDGQKYYAKIFKGTIFWDYGTNNGLNIEDIVYGVYDSNEKTSNYFTSLNALKKAKDFAKFWEKGVFEINNNTNDQFRQDFNAIKESMQVIAPEIDKEVNEIWIDNKLYNEWILKKGEVYWNFNNELAIENIKYVDQEGHYYTKLEDLSYESLELTNVIQPEAYENFPQKDPALLHPGLIENVDDINQKIVINNQEVKVLLRDGFLYYDFPIEQIEYVGYDPIKKQSFYYTSIKDIPETMNLSNVSSIEQAEKKDIPAPANFKILGDKQEVVEINNVKYNSFFAYGKWYWDIPREILMEVKYRNNNNSYYTSLNSQNILENGLTEVFVGSLDLLIIDLNIGITEFPIDITENNLTQIDNGYFFNDVRKDYIVIDNKAYFRAEDWDRSAYLYFKNEGSYTLMGNLHDKDQEVLNYSFSKSLFKYNKPPQAEKIIHAPLDLTDVIIFINKEGEANIVEVVKVENNFYYNDINELSKIRFVNEAGIYFETMQLDYLDSCFSSVDIFGSNLRYIAYEQEEIYFDKVEEKNLISQILFYSSLGSLTLAFITVIIFRTFSYYKRGKNG